MNNPGWQLHGAQPLPRPAPQQLQQRRAQAAEGGENHDFYQNPELSLFK